MLYHSEEHFVSVMSISVRQLCMHVKEANALRDEKGGSILPFLLLSLNDSAGSRRETNDESR